MDFSRRFLTLFLSLLPILVLVSVLTMQPSFGANGKTLIYSISINDTVTAGTAKNVQRGIHLAERDGAEAIVILLNTPGGLVTATLDILQAMSASEVPVITYVNPQGAIAASAGTFIFLDGHMNYP
ncbi:ATP-dependent Clp protease proteolytic subunit [Pelotomaculum isophthalicicum JI]|uniref:ATP-dependent Clp protease proteolytic subunit n=1 Tax=Pelotomaculum isophthalicicum JI TaxID=947010 RepID=A0A9X4JWB2_9FIRM|nr:ATP-dependent Clp protease proteolytic subunit [Pelotomaculum isophthalicicum]MDF9408803.1 ATP-dependent Clp protease proteolytic subunit [Pelotomaculum isophthalicicum JI]